MALATGGKHMLYSWGSSHQGQLGQGLEQRMVAVQSPISDLDDVELS